MLLCFLGQPFTVLVRWSLVVVSLFSVGFALWDGVHELKGDCPINLIDAMERFPVEGGRAEGRPVTDQVNLSFDVVYRRF